MKRGVRVDLARLDPEVDLIFSMFLLQAVRARVSLNEREDIAPMTTTSQSTQLNTVHGLIHMTVPVKTSKITKRLLMGCLNRFPHDYLRALDGPALPAPQTAIRGHRDNMDGG